MFGFRRRIFRPLALSALLILELVLVIVLVTGSGSILGFEVNRSLASEVPETRHVSDPVVSNVDGRPERLVSIFFVGNSFIFYNDLPTMLANVASSDKGNKVRFKIYSVTRGFAHLTALYQDPDAQELLKSPHMDYLILQEHSSWIFSKDLKKETDQSIKDWMKAAQRLGAQVYFLEDWADSPKSNTYADKDSDLFGKTPSDAQSQYSEKTKEMAKANHIQPLLVGDYWETARNADAAPNLYYTDHHHPSAAGTYLTALVIYRQLLGRDLTNVSFRPSDMSEDQARLLVSIASQ